FDDLLTGKFQRHFRDEAMPSFRPRVNITETEQAYILDFQVPGIRKEDIKIDIEDKMLTVSYDHSEPVQDEASKSIRTEFGPKSFKRSFNLGKTIQIDHITARFDLGILTLNLPKKEEVKPVKKSIT